MSKAESLNLIQEANQKLLSLISDRTFDPEHFQYIRRCTPRFREVLGLSDEVLGQLPIIHITGTKGKGSTCAMIERILRECGYRTGLFTSPHLCDVRERIRINGEKIDEETFALEIIWMCDRLNDLSKEGFPLPGFFQFMTFLALRIFSSLILDVVILEVGIGGRLDHTNIVPSKRICGITSIGLDHTELLGNTIAQIAFEKAGIFHRDAVLMTVPQYEEAMEVLQKRALNVSRTLINVGNFATFKNFYQIQNPSLLKGYQTFNATLAIHIAKAFEETSWKFPKRPELREDHPSYLYRMNRFRNEYSLPDEYLKALSDLNWSGRTQIIHDSNLIKSQSDAAFRKPLVSSLESPPVPSVRGNKNLTFYLDGAHTVDSLEACLNWFASETLPLEDPIRFLLFNRQEWKQEYRLLETVYSGTRSKNIPFRHIFFVPFQSTRIAPPPNFVHERKLLLEWKGVLEKHQEVPPLPLDSIRGCYEFVETKALKAGPIPIAADIFPSLPTALGWFRNFAKDHPSLDVRLLVTGSLYLVGDVLKLLGRCPK